VVEESRAIAPVVSVVVPVRNGADTIRACIESLLGVEFPQGEFEVIVIDNDSSDSTVRVLDHFHGRIRTFKERKRGPSAARNTGVFHALGQLIAFTDADCVVEPAWLKNLVQPLTNPAIGIAGGEILALQPANRIERFGELIHDHRRALEEFQPPYAITMNWASRRAVLEQAGLFDESLIRGEDFDLATRIHAAGYRFVYCPDARVWHRNERTFRGLLREGFQHGRAAIRVREKYGSASIYGSYRGFHTGQRILRNLRRCLIITDRFEAFCAIVFDSGKLLGQASLMASRRQRWRSLPLADEATERSASGLLTHSTRLKQIGESISATHARHSSRTQETQAPLAKKIMLCCYEPPGFGGASAQSYDLLRKMLADGIDASLVNLIDARDREFFAHTFGDQLGNPDRIAGVFNVTMAPSPVDPQPELSSVIDRASPDLIVGIGYIATLAARQCAPNRPLVYYAIGSSLAEMLVLDGWAADAIALAKALHRTGRPLLVEERNERAALDAANLIITNSFNLYQQYLYLYGSWAGKIHPRVVWTAEWILEATLQYAHLAKPFDTRQIDVLFIASSWDRGEKNYPMVRRLAAKFTDAEMHLIGDSIEPIAGVVHHGFVSERETLFKLMGNARTIVCPSIIDAAPGILFQGSGMGCNLVASKNCGNWALCHSQLLAEPNDVDGFAKCIERSLSAKFTDNMAEFLSSSSYDELVETLMVL